MPSRIAPATAEVAGSVSGSSTATVRMSAGSVVKPAKRTGSASESRKSPPAGWSGNSVAHWPIASARRSGSPPDSASASASSTQPRWTSSRAPVPMSSSVGTSWARRSCQICSRLRRTVSRSVSSDSSATRAASSSDGSPTRRHPCARVSRVRARCSGEATSAGSGSAASAPSPSPSISSDLASRIARRCCRASPERVAGTASSRARPGSARPRS